MVTDNSKKREFEKNLFPETYGLQCENLAAASLLKQYVMDHGLSELASAIEGDTVDAPKLVQLIDKAKEYGTELMKNSGLGGNVEKAFISMMNSVQAKRLMTNIDPRLIEFLQDLLRQS